MSSPSSPIALEESSQRAALRLSGEVRIEHVAELSARLRALVGHAGDVCIEWSEAEHVDACALQLLAAFARARRAAGAPLEFCAPQPALLRYLELSGFAAHLEGVGGSR